MNAFIINYGNLADQKGNRKSILLTSKDFYEEIVSKIEGHFGFGGENKSDYYVDGADWNLVLQMVNEHIRMGGFVFIKKDRNFNIK